MKINVLLSDNAKEGFEAAGLAGGLCLLIENGKSIMFDAGNGEALFRNAEKMGKGIGSIDFLVISHGHCDHSDGLEQLIERGMKPRVIVHPHAFVKRYIKKPEDSYVGMPLTRFELEAEMEVVAAKEPYKIDDSVIFLGEIPRRNDFEGRRSMGYYFADERKKDDYVTDDSALAIKSEKGIVVVTGCAHAGICNMIEHAKNVTGGQKVYAVVGGLHLVEAYDNVLRKTAEYLKKEGIERLIPLHCFDGKAAESFKNEGLKPEEAKAGDTIEL